MFDIIFLNIFSQGPKYLATSDCIALSLSVSYEWGQQLCASPPPSVAEENEHVFRSSTHLPSRHVFQYRKTFQQIWTTVNFSLDSPITPDSKAALQLVKNTANVWILNPVQEKIKTWVNHSLI